VQEEIDARTGIQQRGDWTAYDGQNEASPDPSRHSVEAIVVYDLVSTQKKMSVITYPARWEKGLNTLSLYMLDRI
jgi:hypothetical protein